MCFGQVPAVPIGRTLLQVDKAVTAVHNERGGPANMMHSCRKEEQI